MVATKNNTHGECPKGDKKVRRRGRAPGKKRRSLNKLCNRLTKQHQKIGYEANFYHESRRGHNLHTLQDDENRFELPRRINHAVNVPSPNFDPNFSNNRPSAPVYVQNEVDEEPTHMKSKNAKSSIRKIFFSWFRSKFF